MIIVKGDPKAPFSIATTPRCSGGRYSFSRIVSWFIPYNAECEARLHQEPFFESLIFLNLALNPSLPGLWQTLYTLSYWVGFCAAIEYDSFSFKFPFLRPFRVILGSIHPICHLKYPQGCFSSHFYFKFFVAFLFSFGCFFWQLKLLQPYGIHIFSILKISNKNILKNILEI